MPIKKNSDDQQLRRQEQIVARLAVQWLSLISPEEYGAANISAAMDRVWVTLAVHKCASESIPCTLARLQKELRMPRTNVGRALTGLAKIGIIQRTDQRRYVPNPNFERRDSVSRVASMVDAIMKAAKDLAE